MGQKTHPIGLRLGIIKSWDSRWFGKRNYPELLKDRKSTRLNSSHLGISYAVFCLKKKTYENSIKQLRPSPLTAGCGRSASNLGCSQDISSPASVLHAKGSRVVCNRREQPAYHGRW